jgi:hypothetical protein
VETVDKRAASSGVVDYDGDDEKKEFLPVIRKCRRTRRRMPRCHPKDMSQGGILVVCQFGDQKSVADLQTQQCNKKPKKNE